jgi:putative ABC transport system substrate-binding protein
MNRRIVVLGALAVCLAASGCRRDRPAPAARESARPYVIGIFQSVDSPTANEVRRGILQAFAAAGLRDGRDIVVTTRIANNDIAEVQRIAGELADGQVDLIMPLSTQALQAAILSSRRGPIVFGAVAVPYLVGAGKSADNHLANVTGVVSTGPIRQTVALIREVLPGARRLGTLWTSSEVNSEYYLEEARTAAAEYGFELEAMPVRGTSDILRSLQRLLNARVDALFPMSDNTLNSAFDIIGRAAAENATPLFASFLRSVEFGACAALGFDFYDLGVKAGRLAVRVKDGESPGAIPIQSMDEIKLFVNPEAAVGQGVVFPKSVLDRVARSVSPIGGAAGAAGHGLD